MVGDKVQLDNAIIAESPPDGAADKLASSTHYVLWNEPSKSLGYFCNYETCFQAMAFVANFGNIGTNWVRRVRRQILTGGRATPWVLMNGLAFVLENAYNARPLPAMPANGPPGAVNQFPGLGAYITHDVFHGRQFSYWCYHHGNMQTT